MMASCYLAIKTKTWRQLSFARNKNREKQILLYSIPLVLNSLGWWANNTSDRYIVSFLCGVSITGLISAAYKIPSIVSTFGSFFLQAWQITAIKDYENNHDTTIYKDMFILQNAVLCILSGLFILFSKTFGNVFFSKSFAEAWVFAPLLVISALFNQAAGFLGPILGAEYKSNAIGKAAIAGLIINIIFNVVLTILIGPQGITIATAAASFIIFYIRERATNGAIRDHFFIAIMFSWAILCIEAVLVCFGRQFVIASVCVIIVFLIYSRVYLRIGKMLVKRITKKKSV